MYIMDLTMTLGGKLRNTVVCGTQTVEDRNKQQLTITALPQKKNLDSRLCILEPLISGKIFALLPLLLKNLMLVCFFVLFCFIVSRQCFSL